MNKFVIVLWEIDTKMIKMIYKRKKKSGNLVSTVMANWGEKLVHKYYTNTQIGLVWQKFTYLKSAAMLFKVKS